MSTTNHGGPAFPQPFAITESGEVAENGPDTCGMTLRDYFAAKAMQALIGTPDCDMDELADNAYFVADAMLRARSATEGDG